MDVSVIEKRAKARLSLSRYPRLVLFETDEGWSVRMEVGERDFESYEVGKRFQKKGGEDFPVPLG